MFNETYVREYLSVVAEKPEKYYKDYLRLVDRVNRSRAIYKGQPIPVTYQGMFYGEEHKKEFEKISQRWMAIGRKVVEAYVKVPSFRDLFGFDPRLEELILHDPGYDMPVPIGRYDVFYNSADDFKMCEFNTDGASAMNEENTIGALMLETEAMKEYAKRRKLTNLELFDSWVKTSTEIYRRAKGENPFTVAIVDLLEKGTTYEFEEFKKAYERQGFRCLIADPRNLTYEKGKLTAEGNTIDMVYRRLVTADLMEVYDEIRPFLNAYFDNAFLMLGSLRSQPMHVKQLFKILRDPIALALLTKEEQDFVLEHLPWTDSVDGAEDVARLLENKDAYILKPFDGYASRGVYVGREQSMETWKKILEEVVGTGYIYQEYFDMDPIDFVEFDEEGRMSVRGFSAVIGMFIYGEKFAGLYTRIGRQALISGARDYYTTPGFLVETL